MLQDGTGTYTPLQHSSWNVRRCQNPKFEAKALFTLLYRLAERWGSRLLIEVKSGGLRLEHLRHRIVVEVQMAEDHEARS